MKCVLDYLVGFNKMKLVEMVDLHKGPLCGWVKSAVVLLGSNKFQKNSEMRVLVHNQTAWKGWVEGGSELASSSSCTPLTNSTQISNENINQNLHF